MLSIRSVAALEYWRRMAEAVVARRRLDNIEDMAIAFGGVDRQTAGATIRHLVSLSTGIDEVVLHERQGAASRAALRAMQDGG